MNTNQQLTPEQEADLQERLTRAQDGIQAVLDKEQFVLDSTLDTQELKISLPIKLVSTKRYISVEEVERVEQDIPYVSEKSNPLEENDAVESLNKAIEKDMYLDSASEEPISEPILSPYNTHDDEETTQ